MRRWSVLFALCCGAAFAAAHVQPSVDDNNRYLKLAPMGDRVRLAYTVFFGEVPGASMRRDLDANRDGQIDDKESQRFGEKLAAQVADGLDVEIDGAPHRVRWAQISVGMGTPATAAGSFSVDLIAPLCLPSARGAHSITLRDRFRVTRPGETEVLVEDTPGVTIDRARIGAMDPPDHDYKFVGPGGPLSDTGLELHFTAGERAVIEKDGACELAPPPAKRVWIVVAGAAVIILGAIYVIIRIRSARR